ncbi:MAG: DNA starvation/stationary phase protection protein [Planctomycetota bacterium]
MVGMTPHEREVVVAIESGAAEGLGNPVGLPREAAEKIARELDRHLGTFFTLFHQYQKHHWLVEGPQFRDLHHFLESSYTEVHKQLDAIAERITAIGAVPTSSPSAQEQLAYIEHEPEGIFRVNDMIERNRHAERSIAIELRSTIKLCTENEDFAIETLLKGILLKVEDRAHHIDHFLGEDSLTLALTADEQGV